MQENSPEDNQAEPAPLPDKTGGANVSDVADPNADVAAEGLAEEAVETEEQKKKRESEEKKQRAKEFGGSVSLWKLVSLATPLELSLFFFGIICTMAHGSAQPIMCLMFGELIDALAMPVGLMNSTAIGNSTNMAVPSMGDNSAFMSNLGSIALKFTVVGFIVTAVGTVQGSMFGWFSDRQVRRMRPIYLDLALHRDVVWYDTHDASSLATEMGDDLDHYTEGFGLKLGASFMSIGAAVVGLALGIHLQWKVGLLMCLSIPVMGLGGLIMAQSFMEMQSETQGAYVKASTIVNEVLFAMRTVVSFGGERKELARFGVAVEAARKGGVKSRVRLGFGGGYIWGAAYFGCMALAFWYGMTLVYDGEKLSVGDLLASFFCVLTAGFTVGQIPPGFAALYSAKHSMARFFYLKEREDEIQRRLKDDRKEMGPIESLQMKGVHFGYSASPKGTWGSMYPDQAKVLHGLSMDIKKGQKVAIVGESGCGKSTVMALLERFYDPDEGQVLVNGEDLRTFSVKSYRKQVGYVGQEPVLFATSVKANIKLGRADATDEEIRRVAAKAQLNFVDDLPEKMETFVGSGGSQFSGGQKQRIAIARALLKNPSLLFLDEATSALDSKSEREIQNTIDSIGSESGGVTMVTIAHRLTTVKNSDVIYVLQGGQVAESGTSRELMHKPDGLYRALAEAQHLGEDDEDKPKDGGFERQLTPTSRKQPAKNQADAAKVNKETEEAREAAIAKTYKVPMRRLLSFCRPEWGYFVPGFICALASGACFPIIGVYILVDSMVAFLNPDREAMRKDVEMSCIWFLVLGAVKWVATVGQNTCFGILGEAMTKRCRVAMLTTMFRQEIGFHDDPDNTPGKLEKALQLYAFRIQVLTISLGEQADSMCAVLVGIVLAFINCWEMTLAMFFSIPIFAISQGIQIAMTMGNSKKENSLIKNAQQVVADSVMNVRTVQASGCEKDLLNLYHKMLPEPTAWQEFKTTIVGGFAFGFANGVMFWVLAGGFWFMGWLIEEGRTDFQKGQASFMGVLYAGLGAAMGSAMTGNVGKAKAAAHDMFELLDRKSSIDGLEPDGVTPKEDGKQLGRFEFTDVNFYYPFRPEVQVLKSLSFTIEAGQSVGVVGPSGGGKSTVMAMIQRFYDPQSGSILIGQERTSLSAVDIRWWRRQVGFVGQEPILFDDTVLANVKYGLSEGEELAQEHLEECGRNANLGFLKGNWDTPVGSRGGRLSGGQKQRVAICRALVRNPPVLLLDEATSALDTKSERHVQRALDKAREGRTSFAIAHRLSTIMDCNVILVVAEGKVVERGTHQELLNLGGVYQKLQAQASGNNEAAKVN